VNASLRDLLEWVDRSPRSYGETMDAWGSHCPRFTTWEDALADDLVHVVRARVELTLSGQAALGSLNGDRPR